LLGGVETMNDKVLVLIVGTNPLPNYVVGSCLKENYDKFVLIYSEKDERINQSSTADYAEKLKERLNLNNCTLLPLRNVSNPSTIRNDLEEKFPKDNIDEVHLNYTGGTKTMVVNVYNFLKETFIDKFNASYIDARTHELIYDNNEKAGVNLKDKIKIDIDTLLSIHLYDLDDRNNFKIDIYDKFKDSFDNISKEIENAIKNDKGNYFVEWLSDPFRKIFKDDDKFIEKASKFKEHIEHINNSNQSLIDKFNNKTNQFIWDILNAFPENKRINDGQKLWIPEDNITNNGFSNRIEDTVKFLDGRWLEWYVYNEIRNELVKEGLQEEKHFGISLKAQKGNSPNFELDIFIINGYQLAGVSITTLDKKLECKLKGFEVIHRVRQIGGDESKAILITGMKSSKKDDLQKDLSFVTGTAEDKIVVFGLDDWADIGSKVCEEVFR